MGLLTVDKPEKKFPRDVCINKSRSKDTPQIYRTFPQQSIFQEKHDERKGEKDLTKAADVKAAGAKVLTKAADAGTKAAEAKDAKDEAKEKHEEAKAEENTWFYK